MQGGTVAYIVFGVVGSVYMISTSIWYFYRLNITKHGLYILFDRHSELNKRSSLLLFLLIVNNLTLFSTGCANLSSNYAQEWIFPPVGFTLVTQVNIFVIYI